MADALKLNVWDGTKWVPVAVGGGGGVPGPAGADGISINVSGPQPTAPTNPRKGDHWIDNAIRDANGVVLMQAPTPVPETILIKRLPPTPEPVIVYLQ